MRLFSRPCRQKLAASATTRRLRLRGSAALLAGRIFDDRGNRMTPTHTNKRGARYRYYVSHVILQKRGEEAGKVSRVTAADNETAVVKAVREHLGATDIAKDQVPADDRDLIERHVKRVIIKPGTIEIGLGYDRGGGKKSSDRGTGDVSSLTITAP